MNIKKLVRLMALGLCVLTLSVFGFTSGANATLWTLTDTNSTVTIDSQSQTGMSNWVVDGIDNLFQQWFWYGIGTGPEFSIDTLTLTSETLYSPSILDLVYQNNQISVDVIYFLTGGSVGSGNSDVGETIVIKNLTETSLNLRFFQYTDFDLGGTPNDDTAYRSNANTMHQTDASGYTFSEVVAAPGASHYQVDIFPTTLNALNDLLPTTLLDNPGPVTGDVTFAWQWNTVINPRGSFIISKDKLIDVNPVPEPATILLIGAGLMGVYVVSRKKG